MLIFKFLNNQNLNSNLDYNVFSSSLQIQSELVDYSLTHYNYMKTVTYVRNAFCTLSYFQYIKKKIKYLYIYILNHVFFKSIKSKFFYPILQSH